jgi:hypothetical protein
VLPIIRKLRIPFDVDPAVIDTAYLESELKNIVDDYRKADLVALENLRHPISVAIQRAHLERNSESNCESNTPREKTQAGSSGLSSPLTTPECAESEVDIKPVFWAFDSASAWRMFERSYIDHGSDARMHDAQTWWGQNVKTEEQAAEIMAGLQRHIASDKWARGIGIPDAINFLRARRYMEHPKPAKKASDAALSVPLPDTNEIRDRVYASKRRITR